MCDPLKHLLHVFSFLAALCPALRVRRNSARESQQRALNDNIEVKAFNPEQAREADTEGAPFSPGLVRGLKAWSLLEELAAGDELVKPDYETVEIQLPWEAENGAEPLVRCPAEGAATPSAEADANLHIALQHFCGADLGNFTQFYVDSRFVGNYNRLTGDDGWIDKAFLTYMGIRKRFDDVSGEEDLLVQSLHHFSQRPVVVANFGKRVPRSWTPERFPNLVLMHAPSTTTLHKSFNFNKHTAMLFTKVKSGLVLDADQFANRGLDYILERAAEETTKAYPYPIMPVHWLSRDPESDDMQAYPQYYSWKWKSPQGAPKRTMRWGHAHPTWSHHALPWLAKWTKYALAPERFGHEMPQWLQKQGRLEDEDLMNIALWASNATKQWCKYDVPQVTDFNAYILQRARFQTKFADAKYYPKGIPMIYFTAHNAKWPERSFAALQKLWAAGDADARRAVLYDGRWFGSGQALKAYDPGLKCIA